MSERKHTNKLRARFVVHRATEWAEGQAVRYFLKYLTVDWDANDDENDPVANLLYDVKVNEIPAEFEFVHKDSDRSGGGVIGEEGIEIEVLNDKKRLPLGAIVDLELWVIGRVEFG